MGCSFWKETFVVGSLSVALLLSSNITDYHKQYDSISTDYKNKQTNKQTNKKYYIVQRDISVIFTVVLKLGMDYF